MDAKSSDDFEKRLKKQEETLESLKNVPDLLAKLLGEKEPEQPKFKKGEWSLGLTDEEESVHDDAENLLTDTSKDDGKIFEI